MNRARDWMRQAERDLEHAQKSLELGHWEWACFAAHQAAEKALKAVYFALGAEAFGHALTHLLAGLHERLSLTPELRRCALVLDRLYIPTRYPDSWEAGAPLDYYGEEEARDALFCAGEILRFGQSVLAGPGEAASGS